MALTDVQVRAAKAAVKPYKLMHEGGLYLYVATTGTKSWRRNFTLHGKQRTISFGSYPDVGLRRAAELAAESRRLAARGIDPVALRRGEAAQQALDAAEAVRRLREQKLQVKLEREAAKTARVKDQATLARVAREYHSRILPQFRNPKHGQQWINSLEQHVPDIIWRRPVAEIGRAELVDALVEIQRRVPETGRRVQQRLGVVFEEAIFRGLIEASPMTGVARRVREVVGKQPKSSFTALPPDEVPALMAALDVIPGISALALRFATLTAARTGEVLGAVWSEIDSKRKVWTIPGARMKGGEAHRVHLAPAAIAIVDALPRGLPDDILFRSPQGAKLSNMALLMVLGRLGLRDRATVHGFRSSFSTWANESARARPDVIEACLAHQEQDRVRAAYNRAEFETERRELLEGWAAFVTGGDDGQQRQADEPATETAA